MNDAPPQTVSQSQTVSQYLAVLNQTLAGVAGEVVGEISQISFPVSGHVYFTIKDPATGDVLPAIIWKGVYQYAGVELAVGLEVLLKGSPQVYGPNGCLSFIARSVELVGEGALKLAYDKLKQKLTAAGLFDEAQKRPLPQFPRRIGLITSAQGEVIHDFSGNLRQAGFLVRLLPSLVEGAASGRPLALSVRAMRREAIDVLVIIRGGGSIQSLAGFDNEALVREIAAFPVPVIAGVGHHRDITLAALAADRAVSTPSMVAALLNESWNAAEQTLAHLTRAVTDRYEGALTRAARVVEESFASAHAGLGGILRRYEHDQQRLVHGVEKLGWRLQALVNGLNTVGPGVARALGLGLTRAAARIGALERVMVDNDPAQKLRLGYSIVTQADGAVVRGVSGLAVGQTLAVRLADGSVTTNIKAIN